MKTFKYLSIFIVMLAACMGFASCSDDDNDEPDPKPEKIEGCDPAIIGIWRTSDGTYTEQFTFYDDGTFVFKHTFGGTPMGDSYVSTYYGDYAAQNGTIEVTFTSRRYTQTGSTQTTDYDSDPVRGTYSIQNGILLIKGFSVPNNNSIPMFDTFAQQ